MGPSTAGRAATAGFTLLELLLTIVILLICGALVIPRIGSTDATRVTAAARLLAADVGFAQADSMAHGHDRRVVVLDRQRGRYSIAARSDLDVPVTNPIDGRDFVVEFGRGRAADLEGVTIWEYDLDGDDTLGFGAHGEPDQTFPASITLRCGDHLVTITVDPDTGETTIGDVLTAGTSE